MDREILNSRTNLFGMLVPNDEIEQTEQMFGGKILRDPKLNAFLNHVVNQTFRKEGKIPQEVTIRDKPFKRYITVQVEAEIYGFKGMKTNKFLFIEVGRIL